MGERTVFLRHVVFRWICLVKVDFGSSIQKIRMKIEMKIEMSRR